MAIALAIIDFVLREMLLLACVGLVIGGIDDLLLDLVFWFSRPRGRAAPTIDRLPAGAAGRLAMFVPAWDEGAVIGAMLATALDRLAREDVRLYVGVYPNDPATIDAVARIAERDPRIRIVVTATPGPTTKADCLNYLWAALLREERAEQWQALAVILHDAEDVVHREEIAVYRACLTDHDVVQLPVMPIVDRASRLIGGHYLDEFAEAHGKSLAVRAMVGAPLPLAGTGCAIRRDIIARLAMRRGGGPFDPASMTEDYELGLRAAALGGRQIFAAVTGRDGRPVAVRAYFPATLDAAVRQKARWMTGIALSGWDRLGWGAAVDWRDHWMRMRDRRAPLAVIILFAAYVALVAWALSQAAHFADLSQAAALDPLLIILLTTNAVLMTWRLAMRALFTWRWYGPIEAALSIVRAPVANLISLLAARRALWRYVATLRGSAPVWDKTAHRYPSSVEA
jgi:bacteriophage N4 adsorption protein B